MTAAHQTNVEGKSSYINLLTCNYEYITNIFCNKLLPTWCTWYQNDLYWCTNTNDLYFKTNTFTRVLLLKTEHIIWYYDNLDRQSCDLWWRTESRLWKLCSLCWQVDITLTSQVNFLQFHTMPSSFVLEYYLYGCFICLHFNSFYISHGHKITCIHTATNITTESHYIAVA